MADISITAANFVPSANATLVQGVAGASMTRGQPLYYDSTNGLYKLFNASNTSLDGFVGMACEDAATNQPIMVVTKDPALALGATINAGETVYGSGNVGALTKTQADLTTNWRVWVIGVATGSGVINFVPCKGGIHA